MYDMVIVTESLSLQAFQQQALIIQAECQRSMSSSFGKHLETDVGFGFVVSGSGFQTPLFTVGD